MPESETFWEEREDANPAVGGEMSRTGKIILGILTFWMPVYMVLFIGFIASTLFLSGRSGSPGPAFQSVFCLHFLTIVESIGLTFYYAVNVYREPALVGDRKLIWMVIVLMGGFIGQVIYYVLWIVKRSPLITGASNPPDTGP